MKLVCSLFMFGLLSSCKAVRQSSEEVLSEEEAAAVILKIKDEDTYLKKTMESASKLDSGNERCKLQANTSYKLKEAPKPADNHSFVSLASQIPGCEITSGYVFSDHINIPAANLGSFCNYSWEEKPGTTDYTTRDEYSKTVYPGADRSQSATLIGSSAHKSRTMCQKAAVLKVCFQKAVVSSNQSAAVKFRTWAKAHNVNPVIALMAKAQQETKLGSIGDTCIGRTCNGIGMGQIITAVDENGRLISDNDPRWKGITHNILTNLTFSVRVIAAKTSRANSLWDLAYYYNGSPAHQNQYADNVTRYYSELQRCGL